MRLWNLPRPYRRGWGVGGGLGEETDVIAGCGGGATPVFVLVECLLLLDL